MQILKTFLLNIIVWLMPTILFSQSNSDTTICYTDSIKSKESVLTYPFQSAYFKGGPLAFKNILMKQINHNNFIAELSKSQSFFRDTARVKMIVSKGGTVSNLQIEGTKNEHFKSELKKALIHSACFWDPGDMNGRRVNSWYKFDLFYFMELINGELKISITSRGYGYGENSQSNNLDITYLSPSN